MAGKPKRALLVIDVQNVYTDPNGPRHIGFPDVDCSVKNVERAMDAAAAHGIPSIVIKHESSDPSNPYHPASKFSDITDGILDRKHDRVIIKALPGSFHGTGLEEALKQLGVDTVVVCGFMTNMCCDTTSRQAFHRGFKVEFLSDATGAIDLPDVKAEVVHRTTLATMAMVFAKVTTTDQWIASLGFVEDRRATIRMKKRERQCCGLGPTTPQSGSQRNKRREGVFGNPIGILLDDFFHFLCVCFARPKVEADRMEGSVTATPTAEGVPLEPRSLKQGEAFEVPHNVATLVVGLRWEPLTTDELANDIDGSALVFGPTGIHVESLFYRHSSSSSCGGSISFVGDTVGGGEPERDEWLTSPLLWSLGDDQQVVVQLAKVPPNASSIVFAVTLTSRFHHLDGLRSLCCRLIDRRAGDDALKAVPRRVAAASGPRELCRFAFLCRQLRRRNAILLGRLERSTASSWRFVAMGTPVHGFTVAQAAAAAASKSVPCPIVAPSYPLTPPGSPASASAATSLVCHAESPFRPVEKKPAPFASISASAIGSVGPTVNYSSIPGEFQSKRQPQMPAEFSDGRQYNGGYEVDDRCSIM